MASEVQICNMALGRIGQATISSLSEQSEEATQCNLFYGPMRDHVLREYPWNFATRRAALATLSVTAPPDWDYVYAYPADCLQARVIMPTVRGQASPPFSIGSTSDGKRVIYADTAEAYLIYTAKVTDPNLFDWSFINALAYRLAAEIVMPLTKDQPLWQAMMNGYSSSLSAATASDAQEGRNDDQPEAGWILARD